MSLTYNLADLMSLLSFLMIEADFAQLGFWRMARSLFRLCQGMSLRCNLLFLRLLSTSDSDSDEGSLPSDLWLPVGHSGLARRLDSRSRADTGSGLAFHFPPLCRLVWVNSQV